MLVPAAVHRWPLDHKPAGSWPSSVAVHPALLSCVAVRVSERSARPATRVQPACNHSIRTPQPWCDPRLFCLHIHAFLLPAFSTTGTPLRSARPPLCHSLPHWICQSHNVCRDKRNSLQNNDTSANWSREQQQQTGGMNKRSATDNASVAAERVVQAKCGLRQAQDRGWGRGTPLDQSEALPTHCCRTSSRGAKQPAWGRRRGGATLPPRRAAARRPPPGSAQPWLVAWLSGWPVCWVGCYCASGAGPRRRPSQMFLQRGGGGAEVSSWGDSVA